MSPETRKFLETWVRVCCATALVVGVGICLYLLATTTNADMRCRAAMQRAQTGHDTTLVMIAGNCPVETH